MLFIINLFSGWCFRKFYQKALIHIFRPKKSIFLAKLKAFIWLRFLPISDKANASIIIIMSYVIKMLFWGQYQFLITIRWTFYNFKFYFSFFSLSFFSSQCKFLFVFKQEYWLEFLRDYFFLFYENESRIKD